MLAFHPFGLLDVSQGTETERLIKRSIHHAEEMGTSLWVGYSYAWLANMKARVADGDGAARALHIFIKAFCAPNSFQVYTYFIIKLWKIQIIDKRWLKPANKQPINNPMSEKKIIC